MKHLVLALVGVLIASSYGCVPQVEQRFTITYQQKGFTPQSIPQGDIAFMPAVGGYGEEGHRREFADSLQNLLKTYATTRAQVMEWQDTLRALNGGGLIGSYSKLVTDYKVTAVLDKGALQQIKEATGRRFLLVVFLDASTSSAFNESTGKLDVETDTKVYIWDTDEGDVVWEAIGAASVRPIVGALVGKDLADPPSSDVW